MSKKETKAELNKFKETEIIKIIALRDNTSEAVTKIHTDIDCDDAEFFEAMSRIIYSTISKSFDDKKLQKNIAKGVYKRIKELLKNE